MANTLTYAGTVLALPGDLLWADEYSWQPVVMAKRYSLTGALIVDTHTKQAGRSVTLRGGADYAWCTRQTLEQLRTWAAVAGRQFSLVLRDEPARTVAFDIEAGAIEAQQLTLAYDSAAPTDIYAVTLRFIEV